MLLLLTGLAGAQRARTLADKDDSRSAVDIKSARGVHDRGNDRLAHLIRFHGPISPRNFRNAVQKHGPPGSVCVNIWTRRKPWEASPNYDVCVTADRNRARLLASVSRHGPKGGVRRIGNASAQLTTPRRLSIRFDPDLIRRPGRYRWSAHVTTFERGCTRRGCQDVAPRRGRSARTKLGAPAL
ncbi:MAG TPA: hypothetical protein VD790_06575 [Thermoleophilaceae bacterium]|nr:hypothetical protein [Thermoleophilaceae bacterium]